VIIMPSSGNKTANIYVKKVTVTVTVHTPCPGKKRQQYSRHNFDKFSHSFVIFGMNHPDTSVY